MTFALFEFDSDDDVDQSDWNIRNERAARRKLDLQQSYRNKRRAVKDQMRARKVVRPRRDDGESSDDDNSSALATQKANASVLSVATPASLEVHLHKQSETYSPAKRPDAGLLYMKKVPRKKSSRPQKRQRKADSAIWHGEGGLPSSSSPAAGSRQRRSYLSPIQTKKSPSRAAQCRPNSR